MNYKPNESWAILTPTEIILKKKIAGKGIPLKDWDITISYGIKTGLNDAFVITKDKRDELVRKDSKSAELIRPLLRRKDILTYKNEFRNMYLIVAYNGSYKMILKEKYLAIYQHLSKYENRLKKRAQVKRKANGKVNSNTDYPGQHHWLELDNNPTFLGLRRIRRYMCKAI